MTRVTITRDACHSITRDTCHSLTCDSRLKQLNADRAQLADLTRMKESEKEAVEDLMRKRRELEGDIRRQQERLQEAQQVQVTHDSPPSPVVSCTGPQVC